MRRMLTVVAILGIGLLLVGLLALRHAIRTAPTLPAQSDLPAPQRATVTPVDQMQSSVKLGATSFQADPEKSRQLMEKLRQEELRQRPQEQRN